MVARINRKIIKPIPVKYNHDNNTNPEFYNNKSWKKLRNSFIKRFPLCQNCLQNGIIRPAKEVHHKQFFQSASSDEAKWNLFLNESNLMSLCPACHRAFHKYARRKGLSFVDYLDTDTLTRFQ